MSPKGNFIKRKPLERCVMCLHYASSPSRVKCLKRPDGPYNKGLGCCSDFDDIAPKETKQP